MAMEEALAAGTPEDVARLLFNGLQETVFALRPGIAALADALRSAGALGTLLSGSGGAVFGIARDAEHAEAMRRTLPPGIWSACVTPWPSNPSPAASPPLP